MNSVILSAVRTPIGAFMGSLSAMSAPQLGAIVVKAAVEKAGLKPEDINEVIMGNVLTGGVGQAPARQAAIYAGLPDSVPCMTVNKVCGSGLKSVMLADNEIRLGDAKIIVAGGQESMSNAPYFLKKARTGYRMGHGELTDMMIHDGLWDVYNDIHMGNAGELCADKYDLGRQAQDDYAIMSYKRAIEAQEKGYFADEMIPVEIKSRKGSVMVEVDEEPTKVRFEKIPQLRAVFKKDGTVTAANASSIDDGASALAIAGEDTANTMGLKPMARILGHTSFAQDPQWFTTAPAEAIKMVCEKANIKLEDIDLFEINEAFAVVPMVTNKLLGIPYEKINIHGGAISMGHPIGCSGARVLTTLVHALKRTGGKYGLATLCIGGGEASAMIIEMM